MLVRYNGKVIAKKDQRFKDDFWTDGKKDPRIRKRKTRKLPKFSTMFKRGLSLILVLGFVGLHTADFNQNSTTTPAEAENASKGVVEPPEWIKEKYPDNQINEFDGGETGDLFDKYFGSEANIARAIAQAESGMDAGAVGDTNTKYYSVGLMQIRMLPERKLDIDWLKVPENNLSYAKMLYDKYGWNIWTMYNNGEYKKYLRD